MRKNEKYGPNHPAYQVFNQFERDIKFVSKNRFFRIDMQPYQPDENLTERENALRCLFAMPLANNAKKILAMIDSGLLLKPGIQNGLPDTLIEDSGCTIKNMFADSKTGWIIKLYGSKGAYHITVRYIIDDFDGKINETFTGEVVDKFIKHVSSLDPHRTNE